jgi:16S rRNA (cytosine967-C5)-methyltransferase
MEAMFTAMARKCHAKLAPGLPGPIDLDLGLSGADIESVVLAAKRKGLERAADAGQPQTWWDGEPFDGILLDAPCTASGIGRRHPDVRWLRRETDVDQLSALQSKLLLALWPLVKPGGRLLYCTCSVFKAEGESQIQTFLQHNTDATILPSPGHLTPSNVTTEPSLRDNRMGEHDGFYYALLQKHPA